MSNVFVQKGPYPGITSKTNLKLFGLKTVAVKIIIQLQYDYMS